MPTAKYHYICSGYLVEDNKILLVLHKKFKKWVPPGGHVEDDELFAETAEREFREETNLIVKAISAAPVIHFEDSNATPLPLPFYTDVMREGFKLPTIGQYFYVRRTGHKQLKIERDEIDDAQWFTVADLDHIPTFEQVRSVCRYALKNYPGLK